MCTVLGMNKNIKIILIIIHFVTINIIKNLFLARSDAGAVQK